MARLNVWFAAMDHPFKKVAEPNVPIMKVNIYDMDGPFRWCGRTYLALDAKCGHLEIELPPGCYLVAGTVNAPWEYPNYDTDLVKVDLCCDDHVCITLIPHHLHSCVWWTLTALQTHLAVGTAKLPREDMTAAINALAKLEPQIPKPRFATQLANPDGIRKQLLDDARKLRDDSRRVIAGLQAAYAAETDVRSLKIKHNHVLGYFIEVGANHGEKLMLAPSAPENARFTEDRSYLSIAGCFASSTTIGGTRKKRVTL